MKLFKITALALLMHGSFMHANDEDSTSKSTGITAATTCFICGSLATLYGLRLVKRAYDTNNMVPSNESLIRHAGLKSADVSRDLVNSAVFLTTGLVFSAAGFASAMLTFNQSPECNHNNSSSY